MLKLDSVDTIRLVHLPHCSYVTREGSGNRRHRWASKLLILREIRDPASPCPLALLDQNLVPNPVWGRDDVKGGGRPSEPRAAKLQLSSLSLL